jgi:hypothetical protein
MDEYDEEIKYLKEKIAILEEQKLLKIEEERIKKEEELEKIKIEEENKRKIEEEKIKVDQEKNRIREEIKKSSIVLEIINGISLFVRSRLGFIDDGERAVVVALLTERANVSVLRVIEVLRLTRSF